MNKILGLSRHAWRKDHNGKKCLKCNTRIDNINGFNKFIKINEDGIITETKDYPKCSRYININ